MRAIQFSLLVVYLMIQRHVIQAFGVTSFTKPAASGKAFSVMSRTSVRMAAEDQKKNDDGVIELADSDDDSETEDKGDSPSSTAAPFLSQGEISEEAMSMDLRDPKQTRVIIYIILSLLPVLFLIPLMLGSREFLPAIIPMDNMPPVQL